MSSTRSGVDNQAIGWLAPCRDCTVDRYSDLDQANAAGHPRSSRIECTHATHLSIDLVRAAELRHSTAPYRRLAIQRSWYLDQSELYTPLRGME